MSLLSVLSLVSCNGSSVGSGVAVISGVGSGVAVASGVAVGAGSSVFWLVVLGAAITAATKKTTGIIMFNGFFKCC